MKRFIPPLLLISSLFLTQCGGGNSNPGFDMSRFGSRMQRSQSVETININPSAIADQIISYGNIQSQELVTVVPQVSNRIIRIYVDLGDTVKKGDPISKILDTIYRDQVNSSRSQLEQATIGFRRDSTNYARQLTLFEQGLSSSAELDNSLVALQQSRSQVAQAKATLTQSLENLSNTLVKAPVDGVIVSRNMEVGDLATTGQTLVEITSFVGLETRVYLPLKDWDRVRIGQSVDISITNVSQITAQGVVTRISPRLDPQTGLGEVVITYNNRNLSIYQGALVKTAVNVLKKEGVVTIPRSALVENVQTLIDPESNSIRLERTFSAFIVKGDTLAVRRDLKLGIEQGDRIEVLSGLYPGESLIITGQSTLEDSAKIKVAGQTPFQIEERPQIGERRPDGGMNREALQNMTPAQRDSMRKVMTDRRNKRENRGN